MHWIDHSVHRGQHGRKPFGDRRPDFGGNRVEQLGIVVTASSCTPSLKSVCQLFFIARLTTIPINSFSLFWQRLSLFNLIERAYDVRNIVRPYKASIYGGFTGHAGRY